jgi:hypothetical protein
MKGKFIKIHPIFKGCYEMILTLITIIQSIFPLIFVVFLSFLSIFSFIFVVFVSGPLSGMMETRGAANPSSTTKPIRARVKEWFFKVFKKVLFAGQLSKYLKRYYV